ncbi:protein kinase [Archangium violaceum]|uniref:protein kinase domain-containing protein n=1 Tax=Archangium violaceum TaxID=83451 RepID=UPI002B316052|nr:protein kinase [Archangium gephyra]
MNIGRYQLVSKLATGGMAEVYLARAAGPMGFEKTLVLKRILPHLAEDPHFVEMFLAEATLAAQLEHPNIVQIFDFGESDGFYYLAMEYIDGPNLRTLSKRARAAGMALPPAFCARIIASACEGLAYAHDFADPRTGEPLGLIHRDISPDNILLSRQGAVKVVDFGIAKAVNQSHKTQTGFIKGKIAYMPPEQLQVRLLDRRVDVYALGIVLYELLTGQKPFDATTDVSMMQAIVSEPIVPAMSRRPDLPPALGDILDKALSKMREQRYPDCRAFQAELEHFIHSSGEPVGAYQLSRLVAQLPEDKTGHVRPPRPGSGPTRHAGSGSHDSSNVTRLASNESDTGSAKLAEPTLVSSSIHATPLDEAKESAPPSRRTGRRRALAGLALFAVAGGFVLFRDPALTPSRPPEGIVVAAPSVQQPPTSPPPATSVPTDSQRPHLQPPVPTEPSEAPLASPSNATRTSAAKEGSAVRSEAVGKRAREKRVVQHAQVEADTLESPPPSPARGILEFRIRPYAIIYLDSRLLGPTPVAPVEVEAGPHTVRLINQESGKDVVRTIHVRAGQSFIFKYNLLEEEQR